MGLLYFILFCFVVKLLYGFIQVTVEYYREQKAKKPPSVEPYEPPEVEYVPPVWVDYVSPKNEDGKETKSFVSKERAIPKMSELVRMEKEEAERKHTIKDKFVNGNVFSYLFAKDKKRYMAGEEERPIFVNYSGTETGAEQVDFEEPVEYWFPAKYRSISVKEEFDSMEGHDFEYFCADILERKGYEDVFVTPGSGDFGVDVLCRKDGFYYGIQCKRYDKPLGNKPIQEVFAGKKYYGCDIAVVLTNNFFTDGAKELARKTDVILWDRYDLFNLIE